MGLGKADGPESPEAGSDKSSGRLCIGRSSGSCKAAGPLASSQFLKGQCDKHRLEDSNNIYE